VGGYTDNTFALDDAKPFFSIVRDDVPALVASAESEMLAVFEPASEGNPIAEPLEVRRGQFLEWQYMSVAADGWL